MNATAKSPAQTQKEQTITSIEIAQVCGKRHKDVLRSVRDQENAWSKVTGRKFALSEYLDKSGRKLPMYNLSKTESLYITSKYNDEVRAKLVKRWFELEMIHAGTALKAPEYNGIKGIIRGDHTWYEYREAMKSIGASPDGAYRHKKKFPDHFLMIWGRNFISQRLFEMLKGYHAYISSYNQLSLSV